jgi:ADP-ribose pyrophosphatase
LKIQPINQKTLLRTKLFNVEAIEMELPNQKHHTYNLVRHADSVTILPVDEQGRIQWGHQYRVGAGMELLELPAGVIDDGESPLECAQRETQEEIGMKAGELLPLGSYYLAPGYCSEVNHAFLARRLSRSQLSMDEDEFIDIQIIPVSESYQMAREGKIKDAKSLAALLLAGTILSG